MSPWPTNHSEKIEVEGRVFLFLAMNEITTISHATRRSVEHCTLHTNGAWLHFTGLNDRAVPVTYMLAKCGRGSISLQSPDLKWYESNFEFVMLKNLPIPF